MKVTGIVAAVVAAVALVVFVALPSGAITCGDVNSQLAPCLPYLIGMGAPTAACCEGVKNLKAMAATTADKQAACNCAKEAASRYQVIKEGLASALAAKCGVELSVPISKNTDCASIK